MTQTIVSHTIHHEREQVYRAAFEKNDDGRRTTDATNDWRLNPAENWRKICDEEDLFSINERYGYRKYSENRIAGMTHEQAITWLHEHGVWQWKGAG